MEGRVGRYDMVVQKKYIQLDKETLARGLCYLRERDADLDAVVRRLGSPPLWLRPNTFASLVHIILEQQVSLASARAVFERLTSQLGELIPSSFLSLDDAELRSLGFSRQKTRYCRELARAVDRGQLDLLVLERCDDEVVREQLIEVKGIGRWTAEIYLLMVLGRPDAWPVGDLAIVRAVRAVKKLDGDPDSAELECLAEAWRPWRSVAARVLWLYYLNR
ncbi:MAG: DNA-3-methyladenine glycosylase II [Candidatus Latescibacterota bacterium]|jgi:DNA-3-methyladenine glycosylase II